MATHSVFLPGKPHGQKSLVGYSPWHHKESDMTENTHTPYSCVCVCVITFYHEQGGVFNHQEAPF